MQLAPPRRTDGRSVDLHLLNDYTNSNVKEEASEYEANKKIKTVPVCAACQGGGQDNPKGWVLLLWMCRISGHIPRITISSGFRYESFSAGQDFSGKKYAVFLKNNFKRVGFRAKTQTFFPAPNVRADTDLKS